MSNKYRFRKIDTCTAENVSKIREKARAARLAQLERWELEIKQQFIAEIYDEKQTDQNLKAHHKIRNQQPQLKKQQHKQAAEEYTGWLRQMKHTKDSRQHSDGELPAELEALAKKLRDMSRSLAKEDDESSDLDYRALFVEWYSFQINPGHTLVE